MRERPDTREQPVQARAQVFDTRRGSWQARIDAEKRVQLLSERQDPAAELIGTASDGIELTGERRGAAAGRDMALAQVYRQLARVARDPDQRRRTRPHRHRPIDRISIVSAERGDQPRVHRRVTADRRV
jgi:hypothetical protein